MQMVMNIHTNRINDNFLRKLPKSKAKMNFHNQNLNQYQDIDNKNKNTDFFINIDLPDVEIIDFERQEDGDYMISVQSTLCGTNCRKCGQYTTEYRKTGREIKLRDLPLFGAKVFIKIRSIFYKCKRCNTNTVQKVEWYKTRSPNTLRFEEHILGHLINSTIQDVAKKEKVTYDTVFGIMKRHVHGEVDWDKLEKLSVLGIDEVSNKKVHREYYVIVTARIEEEIHILKVLPNRKKDTVKNFLNQIPERLKGTIHTYCTDMYDGYVNAAKEVLIDNGYEVKIIIDRFHVAKNYRECVEDVRKSEMIRLKKELTEEEYKKLKGIHWTLRKNQANLSPDEKEQLEYLFSLSPLLFEAYQLRNELTNIFDKRISLSTAKNEINSWIKKVSASSLTCFKTFLKTLNKYFDFILNYFIDRANSGFVEGLNNKLKVIKRCCYGIRNPENFFRRIFLSLEGFRLYG